MNISDIHLKVCPFCGMKPNITEHWGGSPVEIICGNQEAHHTVSVIRNTLAEAVNAWNERTNEIAAYRIGYADGIRAARAEAKKVVEKIMKQEVEGG